jgi:predicted RNase H-like HicB family nuclease
VAEYIGIVHGDSGSGYSLCFPDFLGCVTAGRDMPELQPVAEEALAFHVEGMVEDGEKIPEPSALEAVILDPDYSDGVPILVPLRSAVLAQ